MIGFVIGTLCLVGLVKTLRGGRRWGHHGGWGRRGYGFGGPRAALRFLFERLDTSPGQEKVIAAAVEELLKNKGEIREELAQSKESVARAMRSPIFDNDALEEAFARHDRLQARMRESVKHALSTVHEALDDRQRALLADLFEGGFRSAFMGGGCRGRGYGGYDDQRGWRGDSGSPYRGGRRDEGVTAGYSTFT